MTAEQIKIERAHNRAMNIRDSTPGNWSEALERAENEYVKAYLRAYHKSDSRSFRPAVRCYLKTIRSASIAQPDNLSIKD